MRLECTNAILLEGLNIVTRALSVRTTMEILEGVLIKAEKTGFRIFATNLEMSIDTGLMDADVTETGEVVLDGRTLHEMARKFSVGARLSITIEHGFVAIIESGRTRFSLVGMDPMQYPSLPGVGDAGVFELPLKSFNWLLKQALYAAAQQDTGRPILTGALLSQGDDGELNVVTSDGMRMAYASTKIKDNMDGLGIVIPAQALSEVVRIAGIISKDKDIENEEGDKEKDESLKIRLRAGKHHAVFEVGSATITSRILEGDYLDHKNIFSVEQNILVRLRRTELLDGLERVALISTKDTKKSPIRLVINDERTISLHSSSAMGRAHEVVNIEELELLGQAEAKLEIGFNPAFLIAVLKVLNTENIVVSLNSPLSPAIIRPAKDGASEIPGTKHLVLPVRIEERE